VIYVELNQLQSRTGPNQGREAKQDIVVFIGRTFQYRSGVGFAPENDS
jgi:hypothetical protein